MLEDLVRRAVAFDDAAVDILAERAETEPASLTPHLARLLAANVWWRPIIYRGADDAVRREMVAKADGDAGARLHLLLQALAHAGGPIAEEAFRRWSRQPPPNARLLHMALPDYPVAAGWCLEADGVRPLGSDIAYELVPGGAAGLMNDDLANHGPAGECCPWCGSPLWTALDVDTADPRVAEAVSHTGWAGRLRVVTCHSCACYGPLLCEVTTNGGARWSDRTAEPEFLSLARYAPPARRLVPGSRRAAPYAFPVNSASARHGGGSGSAIGGLPGPVPGSAYPRCPACSRVMAHVATLRAEDLTGAVDGGDPAAGSASGSAGAVAGGAYGAPGPQAYLVFLDAGCALAAVRCLEIEPVREPVLAAPGRAAPAGAAAPPGQVSGAPILLPFPQVRSGAPDPRRPGR